MLSCPAVSMPSEARDGGGGSGWLASLLSKRETVQYQHTVIRDWVPFAAEAH